MKIRVYLIFLAYICGTTALAWLLINHVGSERKTYSKKLFENQTKSIVSTLQERYSKNQIALLGLEGLFNSSEYVSYSEWVQNVDNLQLQKNFSAITWVVYIPIIAREHIEAFVVDMKQQEIKDFKIWPSSNTPFIYPITYIFPSTFSNLTGYNLFANKAIQNQLEKSIATKSLVTSKALNINSPKSKKSERLLFLPLQKSGENQITGWIGASINFATIFQETFEKMSLTHYDIKVYSGDSLSIDNVIYQQTPNEQSKSLTSSKEVFEFAGSKWTFLFKAPNPNKNFVSAYAFYLVLFILIFTLLVAHFFYFFYLKKSGNVHFENQIEPLILKNTQYSVIATDLNGMVTFFNPAAEKLLGYSADEMIGKQTAQIIHDPDEMQQRAQELSTVLKKEVKPDFGVFVAFAEKDIPENKKWTYIRKDKSRVSVQLSVMILKNQNKEPIGYAGLSIETSTLEIY